MKSIQTKREAIGATQQAMAPHRFTPRKFAYEPPPMSMNPAGTYPRPRFLPMIAAFLGCTIDDLYSDENKREVS